MLNSLQKGDPSMCERGSTLLGFSSRLSFGGVSEPLNQIRSMCKWKKSNNFPYPDSLGAFNHTAGLKRTFCKSAATNSAIKDQPSSRTLRQVAVLRVESSPIHANFVFWIRSPHSQSYMFSITQICSGYEARCWSLRRWCWIRQDFPNSIAQRRHPRRHSCPSHPRAQPTQIYRSCIGSREARAVWEINCWDLKRAERLANNYKSD